MAWVKLKGKIYNLNKVSVITKIKSKEIALQFSHDIEILEFNDEKHRDENFGYLTELLL